PTKCRDNTVIILGSGHVTIYPGAVFCGFPDIEAFRPGMAHLRVPISYRKMEKGAEITLRPFGETELIK
ncbi:MAG TPA: hypothetical protein VKJ01_05850, partial [Candidatus Solibacter sp.]|nr:hypothetical protein [Candidatus Solibacter sp.]